MAVWVKYAFGQKFLRFKHPTWLGRLFFFLQNNGFRVPMSDKAGLISKNVDPG